MVAFSIHITNAAQRYIRDKIGAAAEHNPAILLVGHGARKKLDPEVGRAFLAGADGDVLRELFMKHHGSEIAANEWRIGSAVVSGDSVPSGSLIEISGILFVVWPALRSKIDGGSLDFNLAQGFILIDKAGNSVLPWE